MSLEDMKALESDGRYQEAIQMGVDVLEFDENNAKAYLEIMYCFNQLGNYRATIEVCNYAVNNGHAKETDVQYYRNFVVQKLRGRNPGQHSIYNPQDEYNYQHGNNNPEVIDPNPKTYEPGYFKALVLSRIE